MAAEGPQRQFFEGGQARPQPTFEQSLASLVLRIAQLVGLPLLLGFSGWLWSENRALHDKANDHHGQLVMLRADTDRGDRDRRAADEGLRALLLEVQARSEQARAEIARRFEDRANGQERRMGELGGELQSLRDAVIRNAERLDGMREQVAARSGEISPPARTPRAIDNLPRGWRQ